MVELSDIIEQIEQKYKEIGEKRYTIQERLKRSGRLRDTMIILVEWFSKHDYISSVQIRSLQEILRISTYRSVFRVLMELEKLGLIRNQKTDAGTIFFPVKNNGHIVLLDYFENILSINGVDERLIDELCKKYGAKRT